MAQVQPKSESEQKSTKNVSADEGGSWQFKFVIGTIILGVLMLILKTIGLF